MINLIFLLLVNCSKENSKPTEGNRAILISNNQEAIKAPKAPINKIEDKAGDNNSSSTVLNNLLTLIEQSDEKDSLKKSFKESIEEFKKGNKVNVNFKERIEIKENKQFQDNNDIIEFSPLMIALYFNDLKASEYLIEKGANVNEIINYIFTRKTTPLNYFIEKISVAEQNRHYAFKEKFINQIFFLIEKGAKYYVDGEGINVSKGYGEISRDLSLLMPLAKTNIIENYEEKILILLDNLLEGSETKIINVKNQFILDDINIRKPNKFNMQILLKNNERLFTKHFIDVIKAKQFDFATDLLNNYLDNKPQDNRALAEKHWIGELLNLKVDFNIGSGLQPKIINVNLISYGILTQNRQLIEWLIDNGLSKIALKEKGSEDKSARDYDGNIMITKFVRDDHGILQDTGETIKAKPILPDFENKWKY